ncbi:MAG: hypothetical protein JW730_09910 [Anaerolineales bacterium]|nr:hypothetical protein [Anaerolineales bacterium]
MKPWLSQDWNWSRECTRICAHGLIFRVNSCGFAAKMDDREEFERTMPVKQTALPDVCFPKLVERICPLLRGDWKYGEAFFRKGPHGHIGPGVSAFRTVRSDSAV